MFTKRKIGTVKFKLRANMNYAKSQSKIMFKASRLFVYTCRHFFVFRRIYGRRANAGDKVRDIGKFMVLIASLQKLSASHDTLW